MQPEKRYIFLEKLKIPYPVIVEGKYDKIKLASVIDADIFTTDGFGIFNNSEKSALFRVLSEKTPLIILTDSDGGGTLIRSRFSALIPKDRLINIYIPEVYGKEKRKPHPSKAGTLGVEGMDTSILHKLFLPFSDYRTLDRKGGISKPDLYFLGFSGGECSAHRRSRFAKSLGLPSSMSPNAFLSAVNILFSRDEFIARAEAFISDTDNAVK